MREKGREAKRPGTERGEKGREGERGDGMGWDGK